MTYNKKIVNKLSITKKSLWSLILAAKDITNSEETLDSSISINKKIGKKKYTLIYDRNSNTIAECNFIICDYGKMLFSLFFPIIFNSKESPYLIAHLAQTLDGFIATNSGESKYISSNDNLTHIHMIRAISDIIIVGYKTVELDNPMLTTRLVTGKSPMRIIIDPSLKLTNRLNIFKDGNKNIVFTQKVSNKKLNNTIIYKLPKKNFTKLIYQKIIDLNFNYILVEGGATTISNFLEQELLDIMQFIIAPIIIGSGIDSVKLKSISNLKYALRPKSRLYKLGDEMIASLEF